MIVEEPTYPLLTAKQFFEFSFSDRKVELDRGIIRVLDGVTVRHSTIQGNLLLALHARLRGTRYRPYGSSFPIRTSATSVRCADMMVIYGKDGAEHDNDTATDEPIVIFEIVHTSPPRTNLLVKVEEYRQLGSLDTLIIVDVEAERLRVLQRAGGRNWTDHGYDVPIDLILPSLAITLPHTEIFARD